MANATTLECLKYLHNKGSTEEERQAFFATAPYVLRAQIISAQRGVKQAEVDYLVKHDLKTQQECLSREKELLHAEINAIFETCIRKIYNEEVKKLIISVLKILPEHPENIERVNECAGDLFKQFTNGSEIKKSLVLSKEVKLEGSVESMRNTMDTFLTQRLIDDLETLKSKSKYIYQELMKSANKTEEYL